MDLKDIPFISYQDFMIWQAELRVSLMHKLDAANNLSDSLEKTTLVTKLQQEIAAIDADFKQLKHRDLVGYSVIDTLTPRPGDARLRPTK